MGVVNLRRHLCGLHPDIPHCRESDHLVVVHSGYVLPLHSDWGVCLPFRVSVSVGVPRDHRTRTPDNSGRSHDHSLIGAADRSFALRRNDSFAVITNHSRHGPLVVSQLRFSGPVPLNAVASMGQPTQLPPWASLLVLASRASSLCSIFLLVLRNWHSCLLEPRSFRFLLQLGENNSFQVRTVPCKRVIRQ